MFCLITHGPQNKIQGELETILNWMIMKTQNFWTAVKAALIWKYKILNADSEDEIKKKTRISDGDIYLKKS